MIDSRLVVNRAGDLHHLLLARAQARDQRRRIDGEIQGLQKLLRGDVDPAQAVEPPRIGEIQVLSDGEGRHQARLLVDHGDALSEGICGARQLDGRPIQQDPSRGRRDDTGQHFGQRRLAGAVLSEKRMHLPALQREGHIPQRRHTAILLRSIPELKNDRHGAPDVSPDRISSRAMTSSPRDAT